MNHINKKNLFFSIIKETYKNEKVFAIHKNKSQFESMLRKNKREVVSSFDAQKSKSVRSETYSNARATSVGVNH
jgi:hypothetical protein